MIKKSEIENRLSKIIYPNFSKNIVEFGFVKDIIVDGESCSIRVDIPSSSVKISYQIKQEIYSIVEAMGFRRIDIDISQPKEARETSSKGKNVLPDISSFVMVSSGKGGVGTAGATALRYLAT